MAAKSSGPRLGNPRAVLNATRHGVLSQVIHLPEEEMRAYTRFCDRFVAALRPADAMEMELSHACADLQFRLHRLSAAEHNLFAIGHQEHGSRWNTGHPESHSALALAETLRQSNPLTFLSIYEQRLSRRLLQTLTKLRDIQAERQSLQERKSAKESVGVLSRGA